MSWDIRGGKRRRFGAQALQLYRLYLRPGNRVQRRQALSQTKNLRAEWQRRGLSPTRNDPKTTRERVGGERESFLLKRENETERPTLAGKSAATPAQPHAQTAHGSPSRTDPAANASNALVQAPSYLSNIVWQGAGISGKVGAGVDAQGGPSLLRWPTWMQGMGPVKVLGAPRHLLRCREMGPVGSDGPGLCCVDAVLSIIAQLGWCM